MYAVPVSTNLVARYVSPGEQSDDYEVCSEATDRSAWHPEVRQFLEYWFRLRPSGLLPGRQHLDVLDIPTLMPRLCLLDVLREPLRYRYRLVGTKEVQAIGREVTGGMFDEVRRPSPGRDRTLARFDATVAMGIATYRKGLIGLEQDKSRYQGENCVVPFAQDGTTVDMIGVLSVVFNSQGRAI